MGMVGNELREIPARSTPVIFTDANGHTGKGLCQAKTNEDMLRGVGEEGAHRENNNGKLLREFCERTGMVAINTWWPKGGGDLLRGTRNRGAYAEILFQS